MLNENIRVLRTSHNLSQVELARKLGVSKQCVSNWENDNVQPSIEMLVKIAKYFNVTTDCLLDLTSENTVSLDGLSDRQAAHIRMIIADLTEK